MAESSPPRHADGQTAGLRKLACRRRNVWTDIRRLAVTERLAARQRKAVPGGGKLRQQRKREVHGSKRQAVVTTACPFDRFRNIIPGRPL